MKKQLGFLYMLIVLLIGNINAIAQSKDDLKNGSVSVSKYETKKSSGTYSPTGLRGDYYSYWATFEEDGIKKANIYAKTDGSFFAVDFGSWYKYNTLSDAIKAWYIYEKYDVIMKKGQYEE